MATISNRDAIETADAARAQASSWRRPRYIAETFDHADEALAALEAVQGNLSGTAFQTLDWLTILYEELAPSHKAVPRVVIVSDRDSGEVALVLPLMIERQRRVRVARFADLGVSDYNAPLLGPAAPQSKRAIRRAWRAVRQALRDCDLIVFDRMPADISGRANPLLMISSPTRSRHSGNVVVITDTVDAFLASRGKKYRKEVERCTRLWHKEGIPTFARAIDGEAIARVYFALEEQQAARHEASGGAYVLDKPAYRSFYERLAINGTDAGFCHLFSIESQGDIIATLFGVEHDGTFTLLRISNSGSRWSHLSPGRLIVVEAMRYFVERNVRRFDMGMGDYPFKRGFGATEIELSDLIIAARLTAVPRAAVMRTVCRLRRSSTVRAVHAKTKRLLGR